MITIPADIVAQARQKFDALMEMALDNQNGIDMHGLEGAVLNELLQIGRLAIEAHLAVVAPQYKLPTAFDASGAELSYRSERVGLYRTIFGTIKYQRSYYSGHGVGHYEMDAVLNLPAIGPSDFLRILLERLSLSMSYEEASELVADYFPVAKSTRCVQELFEVDSQDAEDYYKQAPRPEIPTEESILVVQADGKGVPIFRGSAQAQDARMSEPPPGKKKDSPRHDGKKRMATVVTVATYSPLKRTAKQIVDSLFDEKSYIPAPSGHSFKQVWATMEGKDAAIAQSKIFVERTVAAPIAHRVLLTDGERALKKRLIDAYPGYVHVLDLLHALSYLWMAADAQFGKDKKAAMVWVRAATLRMLQGGTSAIVDELFDWAEATESPAKYEPIEKAGWYLHDNLGSMRYDEYLQNGWPIATGMVEGACRHIVKDRCERSGQRWTATGVEGMLRLRCVRENGDWEPYHAYRILSQQKRTFGRKPDTPLATNGKSVYRLATEMNYAKAA